MNQFENVLWGSIVDSSPGVHMPQAEPETYLINIPLPDFNLELDDKNDELRIDFELGDDTSYSTVAETFIVRQHSFKSRSFIHDFTFFPLSQYTDIPLGIFFPDAPEEYKKLTPDVCVVVYNTLCIVEFTTTQSANLNALNEAYNAKRLKYLQPILDCFACSSEETRKKFGFESVSFFVIAIGRGKIMTNVFLGEQWISELGVRFEIACRIIQEEKTLQIFPEQYGQNSEQEVKALHFLNSITLGVGKNDASNEFSNDNYRRVVMSATNKREAEKICSDAFLKAAKTAKESQEYCLSFNKEKRLNLFRTEYHSFLSSCRDNGINYNDHLKSVVNFPFVVCKTSSNDLSVRKHIHSYQLGESLDHTHWTWRAAILDYETSGFEEQGDFFISDNMTEEYLLNQLKSSEIGEMDKTTQKELYHRVNIDLPSDVLLSLAKQGLNAKKLKDNVEIKENRLNKKKPFSIDTDCSDIAAILESDLNFLTDSVQSITLTNDRIMHLAQLSLTSHDMSNITTEYQNFVSAILHTNLMSWSKLVSDIATELAISARQHCKHNQFILKKIKDFECFLLIKPTKSSSHIFFSILILKENVLFKPNIMGNVFRNFHENDACYWTEFVSLNEAKIVNWSLMESRMLAAIPYWLEFYGIPPFKLKSNNLDEDEGYLEPTFIEARKMILLTLLVAGADKGEIEEHLSIIRHMTMEAFTTFPNFPKPYKMFDRISRQFRSRLTVFIAKKLLSYGEYIVNGNIKSMDVVAGEDDIMTNTDNVKTWTGLINPLTNFPLINPGQIINIMYLGYIKNKNEKTEVNAESSILTKILGLEEKFTKDVESRIGKINKAFDSKTSHEYNIDLVKYACDYALEKKKLFSRNQLSDDLLKIITTTNVEDVFMTLKASSNFDEEYFLFSVYSEKMITKRKFDAKYNKEKDMSSENFSANSYYHRSKIIEKSVSYVQGDKVKLIDILPLCYEEIRSNGYLRICIFKKQQHGGLREIFVLNFAERVVQFVIEQAGRIICSYYPGETMTHPESKRRAPENHAIESKLINKKGITFTTFTSADAAKWSQNHYSHKFAIMLVRLYPKEWHGFFWNTLELWRSKRIKVGDLLLSQFHHSIDSKYYDKITQNLYDGFKGYKASNWIKPDHSYVSVKTGMMQGILHYISSAFHSVMNSLVEKEIMRLSKALNSEYRCIVTTMQSSDDSGMILTLNLKTGEDTIKKRATMLKTMYAMHLFKNILNEEVSIQNSIKTVCHCSRVFEFNSKFYFSNFHYEPDIKLLFASQLISERESLIERQEELSTLLSSYVEMGGSFYSAMFIQYSQALCCYRALGSSVSPKFALLASCLHLMPEPSIGFFLFDNPICPGLSGFNYNVWINSKNKRVSSAYRSHLENILIGKPGSTLETTSLGLLVRQAFLQYGARYKLNRLKEKISCPIDWVESIDNNPLILFKEATTTEEYMLKVALKLNQRGVSESLSTGVSTTSIMASSAYILNTAIFSILDEQDIETIETEYKGQKKKKATLLSMIASCLISKGPNLTEEQEKILFPYITDYQSLQKRIHEVQNLEFIRRNQEKRRVITSVPVMDHDFGPLMSTMTILKIKWFKEEFYNRTPYSLRSVERAFSLLQRSITWLKSTFKETLTASPFEHAHQMFNWFQRLQTKNRTMKLLGAPINTRRGKSTVSTALNMNFHKFYMLHKKHEVTDDMTTIGQMLHQVIGISSFPLSDETRSYLLGSVLRSFSDIIKFDGTRTLSRLNSIATMIECLNLNPDLNTIMRQIEVNRRGYCGSWILRQSYDSDVEQYWGDGIWSGIISGVTTRIEVGQVQNSSCLKAIYVLNWRPNDVDDFLKGLKVWIKDNHMNILENPGFKEPVENALFYYFNGVNRLKLGVPVLKTELNILFNVNMDESSVFWVDTTKWSEFLTKDFGTLRLLTRNNSDDRPKTLISIPLYTSDWTTQVPMSFTIPFRNMPLKHWIENKPLPLNQCITILRTQVKKNKYDIIDLFRKIIKTRLVAKGVAFNDIGNAETFRSSRYARTGDQEEEASEFTNLNELLGLLGDLEIEVESFMEEDNREDEATADVYMTEDNLSSLLERDLDMDLFCESRHSMEDRLIQGCYLFNQLVEEWCKTHTPQRLSDLLQTSSYFSSERELVHSYFSWIFPTKTFCEYVPAYLSRIIPRDDDGYDPFED